jgi:hypothetical protein
MLKPLAIAIISGLAFQLPLVLIVLPCLLALFGHRAGRRPTVTKAVPEPVTLTGDKTVICGSRLFNLVSIELLADRGERTAIAGAMSQALHKLRLKKFPNHD